MTTSINKMTTEQFAQFRKVIYDHSGIWFPENKQYLLESRLNRRMTSLQIDSFDQYHMLLTTGPFRDDEFQEMCNAITINETSFFRNEGQLEIFENHLLSDLIEKRKNIKRLRIWSAACSSGEEPYTLGIILNRTLGIRMMDWRIEILATDLSERVLDLAAEGVYGSFSFRTVSDRDKQTNFKETDQGLAINDNIKQLVHFQKHNLRDTLAAKRFGQFDAIFCRNVMIYFDDQMRANCVSMFHDRLAPDGVLCVGHSESIRNDARFTEHPDPKAFAYHKSGGKA
ncbi:MAG: protein-glutamate O-methyltransferase CheR [Planctomycetota bacterium]